MEKQKKMRQVLRIIPQNKLKQFKEFSVSDTDSIYFVQNYYTKPVGGIKKPPEN